jgi:spondin N
MRALRSSLFAMALPALVACGKSSKNAPPAPPARPAPPAAPTTPAEYTVIIKSTWTKANFPLDYPSDAHFSGMIGASHNARYSIFAIGRKPTRGLERLSEEGKHSPLNDEIKAAIDAGNALELFESGGLKNWKDSMVTTVRVDPAHPLVDVVNMVAPSPDWFTGATNVNLIENGAWVSSRRIVLPAYDSGGDDGTTYKAADKDANPKKSTTRNTNRHFVVRGSAQPVAVLIFVRKS